jgi:hypothetical protein
MDEAIIKKTYNDWVELLKRSNNEDMLNDPYSIWYEAFHVATILIERKNDA